MLGANARLPLLHGERSGRIPDHLREAPVGPVGAAPHQEHPRHEVSLPHEVLKGLHVFGLHRVADLLELPHGGVVQDGVELDVRIDPGIGDPPVPPDRLVGVRRSGGDPIGDQVAIEIVEAELIRVGLEPGPESEPFEPHGRLGLDVEGSDRHERGSVRLGAREGSPQQVALEVGRAGVGPQFERQAEPVLVPREAQELAARPAHGAPAVPGHVPLDVDHGCGRKRGLGVEPRLEAPRRIVGVPSGLHRLEQVEHGAPLGFARRSEIEAADDGACMAPTGVGRWVRHGSLRSALGRAPGGRGRMAPPRGANGAIRRPEPPRRRTGPRSGAGRALPSCACATRSRRSAER